MAELPAVFLKNAGAERWSFLGISMGEDADIHETA
jgi:hypothetical protein